jgi:ELWxxDGT repeat protein
VHGLELWRSDGTAAGTVLMQDIVPGTGSSSPRHFSVSGDHLFFTANDTVHGRELWAVSLADLGCDDCIEPTPTPRRSPRPIWTPEPSPTAMPATPTPTPHCRDADDAPDCVSLTIGTAARAAGEQVDIRVAFRTGGVPVAGVQIDLVSEIGWRVPDRHACRVNPDIDKAATAFVNPDERTLRALVLSLSNVDAIPDDSILFTCTYEIPAEQAPGRYPIYCRNASAATPDGQPIDPLAHPANAGELVCTDGAVVVEGAQSPPPTGTPSLNEGGSSARSSSGSGCQIDGHSRSRSALALVVPVLWLLRGSLSRRKRVRVRGWA